jgi:putative flippase GtrA
VTALRRFARFNVVSAAGAGVQLGVVALLAPGLGLDPTVATAIGVTTAVVHNFAWHARWTWRDRLGPGASVLAALGRFAGANGAVSLVGSVMMMPGLTRTLGVPAIPANLVTIAACGLLNFWLGGRVCFPQTGTGLRLVPQTAESVDNRPVP